MEENKCIRVFADKKQIERSRAAIRRVEGLIGKLASIFSLAGSEVRLSVLYLLFEEKRLCVCDLSDVLNMQIPAVAQHLRKLSDRGMIQKNREGAMVYYSLNSETKRTLRSFFKLISDEAMSETKAA